MIDVQELKEQIDEKNSFPLNNIQLEWSRAYWQGYISALYVNDLLTVDEFKELDDYIRKHRGKNITIQPA